MDERIAWITPDLRDPIKNPYYQFIATNPTLDLQMRVGPNVALQNDKWIDSATEASIHFTGLTSKRPICFYLITQIDIPGLNFDDPDMIEEIFGKYGDKFQSLTDLDNPSDLPKLVFPDIEERRLEREKENQEK